jgi:hypothetical protein
MTWGLRQEGLGGVQLSWRERPKNSPPRACDGATGNARPFFSPCKAAPQVRVGCELTYQVVPAVASIEPGHLTSRSAVAGLSVSVVSQTRLLSRSRWRRPGPNGRGRLESFIAEACQVLQPPHRWPLDLHLGLFVSSNGSGPSFKQLASILRVPRQRVAAAGGAGNQAAADPNLATTSFTHRCSGVDAPRASLTIGVDG